MTAETDSQALENLLTFLKDSRGFDFTGYKRSSLARRIHKRMEEVGAESEEAYLDLLQVDPDEFTHLFNFILINVTTFFRDPEIWDFLAAEVVPRIAEAQSDAPIRVWVPGCASGEEAYSAAMIFAERLGMDGLGDRVKVYATDVDENALLQARQAFYSPKQVNDVPATFLKKYFEPSGAGFAVKKALRQTVIFGRHDIVQDAPISKVDLLMCRNTLMYLNAETQAKVLAQFYFALNETGFLVLGKAEMLFSHVRSFVPFDLKRRVFTKARPDDGPGMEAIRAAAGLDTIGQITNHARGREIAFELAPVPQIVVDRNGILVQSNDRARSMFGLRPSDLGRPLSDLEISYRPLELRSVIDRATQERKPVTVKDVRRGDGEPATFVDVDIIPLEDRSGRLLGVSITFTDVTRYRELQEELQQSNQELETALEELQSTNEELETMNEELQSTNEELQTTNEELQSTNEELETMNEELQSTNEELHTINEEVRERSDELEQVNLFMDSILSSINLAVVVLDEDLRVQVWNARAFELWGLAEQEVRGKGFLSLDFGLPVDRLGDVLTGALRSRETVEVSLPAVDRRGQALTCRVRCTPMRENAHVRGIIVSMENVGRPDPS